MKEVAVLLCCVYASLAFSLRDAEPCNPEVCTIAKDCRCASTDPPELDSDAPQLIVLTFDDAVRDDLFTSIWEPLLFNRTNPDGNPISATFYVPHDFTDYTRVQELYMQGFEIGVNSISKNGSSEYWKSAPLDLLKEEFGGQKTILETFANIPEGHIIGARTPTHQLEGDISIEAYISAEIQYDNGWPTRSTQMLFPYTLDYKTTQDCTTGIECPTEAHDGFWIAPIINIQGNDSIECNALTDCIMSGTAEELSIWLLSQVARISSTTKAPLTLQVPSSWFSATDNAFEAFQLFLDHLAELQDVFLVSQSQVLDWMRNPVPASAFQTKVEERNIPCTPVTCPLLNDSGNTRYMRSCVPCPPEYPWLGNPLGEKTS